MKRLGLIASLFAALLLTACSGHDYVKSETADAVNPQHKVEQCPALPNGLWTYTLQEKSTDPLVRKQFAMAGSTLYGFSIHEIGTEDYWVIDGQKHRLKSGTTISGYCTAGTLEIDVLDTDLTAKHVFIEIMPEAGAGFWIETKGTVTTRAMLTVVPEETWPMSPFHRK